MADNAFGFGRLFKTADPGASVMRAFNETIARETSLQSIIVPLGDGLWVGLRL
jgi:predicted O-methyltransferase YrrM